MIRSLLGAAALAALAVPAAHATSTADATLSGFHITLTDLAPGDGVAPSITLDPATSSVAQAGAVAPGASSFWQERGSSAFAPVFASGAMNGIGGSAGFAGDPFGSGATLTAHAFGVPGFQGGSGEAYLQPTGGGDTSFVLSPQTEVTFSGLAALQWSASDPRAQADASVSLDFWQFVGGNFVTLASDEFLGGADRVPGDPLRGSASRQVTITFANTTDAAVALNYDIWLVTNASEVDVPVAPPPVDEPRGAWLLLAGALPLAWAARRRIG